MNKQKKYTIAQAVNHNTKLAMINIVTQFHKKENEKMKKFEYITDDQIIVPKIFTCTHCRKNKVKIYESPSFTEFKNNSTMCGGGTVQCINIGYGSIYDMQKFVVVFCDPCITKLSRKKHILQLS